MCQRPVFPVASASSALAKQLAARSSSCTGTSAEQIIDSNNPILGTNKSNSLPRKRVRFEPASKLNSFSAPAYSLCDEDKESMWWTRDELMVSRSPSSPSALSRHPSVHICLVLFMTSNLSILFIAACVLAMD